MLLNDRIADHYPEQQIRERGYFPLADAIDLITHPQVRRVLAVLLDEYPPRWGDENLKPLSREPPPIRSNICKMIAPAIQVVSIALTKRAVRGASVSPM